MNSRHTIERQVFLADTDATGFVYYSRYLEWMEAARVEMLHGLGFTIAHLADQGLVPVVRQVSCKFGAPLRLGEFVQIICALGLATKTALNLEYAFVRVQDAADAGSGSVQVVFLEKRSGRPVRVPTELASALVSA